MRNNIKREILKIKVGNVSMKNPGLTDKERYGGTTNSLPSLVSGKNDVIYPQLYITSKELPDLKGTEAGEEKTLVVKVLVRSHNVSDNVKENIKKEDWCLEIHQIGILDQ